MAQMDEFEADITLACVLAVRARAHVRRKMALAHAGRPARS
jgi:hypothetical protein